MLPILGKPLLEYIITGLLHANLREIILVVGYKKEQVMNFFEDGSQWNVHIEYVEQKKLNGTGGALLLCEKLVKQDHFFVLWGDVLVPYKIYKWVHDYFKKEHHDFILVSNYMDDISQGGAIYCTGDYCIEIIEKDPKAQHATRLNNCGIFILSKEIFDVLKQLSPTKRGELELPSAINYGIKEKNWKVRVLKLDEKVFRGDFGNRDVYETVKTNPDLLRKLEN